MVPKEMRTSLDKSLYSSIDIHIFLINKLYFICKINEIKMVMASYELYLFQTYLAITIYNNKTKNKYC